MEQKASRHGFGPRLGDVEKWIAEASKHVLALAETQHAFVHAELEARLSEAGVPYAGDRLHLDPHILSETVRRLKAIGLLEERLHPTYGGRSVLPKNLDKRRVDEVRRELALTDITVIERRGQPPFLIRDFFNETISKACPQAAPRWAVAAQTVVQYSDRLRRDTLSPASRQELVRDLRQQLEVDFSEAGFEDEFRTWSLPDLEEA